MGPILHLTSFDLPTESSTLGKRFCEILIFPQVFVIKNLVSSFLPDNEYDKTCITMVKRLHSERIFKVYPKHLLTRTVHIVSHFYRLHSQGLERVDLNFIS